LIFEEFVKDAENTIKEILNFLGLEKDYDFKQEQHNPFRIERSSLTHIISKKIGRKIFVKKYVPYKIRKSVANNLLFKKAEKPKMNEETRRKLIEFYYEDVKKLQTLFERKLPWLNFLD